MPALMGRQLVVLAALLMEPSSAFAVRVVVFNLHPKNGGATSKPIRHYTDQGPISQADFGGFRGPCP